VVGSVGGRRPGIKPDALEAGILALDSPFSVKDVSEKVGGSAVTVKAAIDRLEAQGKVTASGLRANERGRASKTWAVA
jgi:predicted ArsR family transcriptional regulator